MLPGVLRAPSSENNEFRRKSSRPYNFPREHTTLDFYVNFKCDQVIKKNKQHLHQTNCTGLMQGETKLCYLWLEGSSWIIVWRMLRVLLSIVSPSPSTGSAGTVQGPLPLASGPGFLTGLLFTSKHCVKGAIFKPVKWFPLLCLV